MSPQEVYCREHADKLDDLHEDVRSITAYIPKIELAMERIISVQDTLRSFAEVHKELFKTMRTLTEDLHQMQLLTTKHEARLVNLEESRRGVLGIASPIISGLILAIIGGLFALVVVHGIGAKP